MSVLPSRGGLHAPVDVPIPTRKSFRYDGMMQLRKDLDGSQGGSAIFRAINAWTNDPQAAIDISANTLAYEAVIQRAIVSQTVIGRANLCRGFVGIDWGLLYKDTDTTPPDEQRTQAVQLLSKYVKAFQNYTLFLWKSRNDVLHEAGSDGLATVHASLNHDITQMYSIRATLNANMQSYFAKPLDVRLRSTPRQRLRWLQLVRLASSNPTTFGPRQTMIMNFFQVESECRTNTPSTGTVTNLTVPAVPSIPQQVPLTRYLVSPRAPTIP